MTTTINNKPALLTQDDNFNYTLEDFNFTLPESLIAQYPLSERCASRLLCIDAKIKQIQHQQFYQLLDKICPGDVVVFNDTKVIPARLFGNKQTGGKVECLIERVLSARTALVQIRASKSPAAGMVLHLADGAVTATVLGREDDLFRLEFAGESSVIEQLMNHGTIPLPPYIKRAPQKSDYERYQTVYAQQLGAVAAPTAGLHFDKKMLEQLRQKGVHLHNVTLHVGAGTFQPIRQEQLQQHQLHSETIHVSAEVCAAINAAHERGNHVIAIGTTVVRCLETAALSGKLLPTESETRLFIRPGFRFRVIDALLTNFHLPQSSLLLLVCAFAGYETMMNAYQQAIEQEYRFYSYGDAMFIDRRMHGNNP